MNATRRPVFTDAQEHLLDSVQVPLLQPGARTRFDQLLIEQHYLHSAHLVGEPARYVAEFQGQWVGVLAWSAAAYHLQARAA